MVKKHKKDSQRKYGSKNILLNNILRNISYWREKKYGQAENLDI